MKKFLSVLLVAVMLMTVMPFTVSATTTETVKVPNEIEDVYIYQYSYDCSVDVYYYAAVDCIIKVAFFNPDGTVLFDSAETNGYETYVYEDGTYDRTYESLYLSTDKLEKECLMRVYLLDRNKRPLIKPFEKSVTIRPQANTYATNYEYTESLEEETDPELEPETPIEPIEPSEPSESTEPTETTGTLTVLGSGACGENATWELMSDGHLSINGTGDMQNYGDYSSDIGLPEWNDWASSISSITIADGITSIGDYAFSGCFGVEEVVIPNNVTKIGISAFESCERLKSIVIPNSVKTMGDYAFCYCYALAEVTLSNSLTAIPTYGFAYTNIESISVPNTVTAIGDRAFSSAERLYAVDLGLGVRTIGEGAFSDTKCRTVKIPNTVTDIGEYCFGRCLDLTSVTLSKAMSTLKRGTFEDCDSLKSITLPSSITVVEDEVFDNCVRLSTIKFSNNLKSFGIINNCGVTELNFPEGFETFRGARRCYYLESIVLPSSSNVPMSDDSDYYYTPYIAKECYKLKRAEIRSTAMTALPDQSFIDASALETVVLPDNIKSIGYQAFAGCFNLKEINLPSSLETIGDYAFGSCVSLKSLDIPDKVTSIGYYAFEYCNGLLSVVLPDGIERLDNYIFSDCNSIKTIVFGKNFNHADSYSLTAGNALESIYFTGDCPVIEEYAFGWSASDEPRKVYYPEGNTTYNETTMVHPENIEVVWLPYTTIVFPQEEVKAPPKDYTAKTGELVAGTEYFVEVQLNTDDKPIVYCTQAFADSNGEIALNYKSYDDCSNVVVMAYGWYDGVYGDVNNDGAIDIKDATELQKYIAGLENLSARDLYYSDLDGDQMLSIRDVTAIMCGLAGFTEKSYRYGFVEANGEEI